MIVRAERPLTRLVDYATLPALFCGTVAETKLLVDAAVPSTLVIGLVMGSIALVTAALERVRPERADYVPLDQPFRTEVAHYLFNYNLGYALGLVPLAGLSLAAGRWLPALWPSSWPLLAQLVLAVVLGE